MKIAIILLFAAVITLAYAAPKKPTKAPAKDGKQKDTDPNPPVKSAKDCTEAKKCVTNKNGDPKEDGAAGRYWTACGGYPICHGPTTAWGGCHYFYGGARFCLW